MMENMTWSIFIALVGVCCSACSIAAFFIGRKKAAAQEGEQEGGLRTDLQYIKDNLRDTTKSLDALSLKLDAQDKQREADYRQMLIKVTELESSYKSLHIRVDELQRRIQEYHHP